MTRWWPAALLGALSLTVPAAAAAQFGGDDPDADEAEDEEDTPEELSRDAFQSGQSKFARGNYSGAASSFREAYQISPRPELLYNIGECEDRDDEPVAALAAFEAYLAAISPVHPRRGGIERRIERLRITAAQREASDREGPGSTPWIVAAIGGAAAVAGGVLLGVGAADLSAANSAPAATPPSEVDSSRDTAYILIGVGVGFLVAGLGTLIGGLYWGLTSPRGGAEEPTVEVGAGLGSLHLRGAF